MIFFFRKIQTEIENYCVVTSHNGARASRRVGRPLKNELTCSILILCWKKLMFFYFMFNCNNSEYVVDFNAFLKEEDQVKVDNLVQKLGTDGIPCLTNEQMYFFKKIVLFSNHNISINIYFHLPVKS